MDKLTLNSKNTDPLVLLLVNRVRRRKGMHDLGEHQPLPAEGSPTMLIATYCQYSGVPPYAVGKEGSKIIESVGRSLQYNKRNEKGSQLLTQEEEREKLEDEDFWKDVAGNTFPTFAYKLFENFICKNINEIDTAARKTISNLKQTLPSILTKGRQTWCPLSKRSIPSPKAFQNMSKFINDNLKRYPRTAFEWIKCYFECMNLSKIQHDSREVYFTTTTVRLSNGQIRRLKKKSVRFSKKIVENSDSDPEAVPRYLMELLCSFCGYLKSKERNKLNRRAIASPNIMLRMFFYMYELFCLNLSDLLEESMISIGGEKKRQRMSATLNSVYSNFSLQGTEDATKWNECLSPEGFFCLPHFFFNEAIRKEHGFSTPSSEFLVLKDVMEKTAFLLSKKRVYLGEGHKTINSEHTVESRFEWKREHKIMMNEQTKVLFESVEDYVDDGYVRAPCGMLMGMLNAGSTIIGLVSTTGIGKYIGTCKCVRSSDDSMSLYTGNNLEEVLNNIRMHTTLQKTMGINISKDKTRYYIRGFGEFTSIYVDEVILSQYGVEIPSCRPSASNPHDDFHSVSKNVQVKLRDNVLNALGAHAYLVCGVNSCRRLYKIKRSHAEEIGSKGVHPEAMLLAGGGLSPWSISNCGLSEVSLKIAHLKRTNSINDITAKYLSIVTDSETPLTAPPTVQYAYNIETAKIEDTVPLIPRNIYTNQSRSNRTQRSVDAIFDSLYTKSTQSLNNLVTVLKPLVEFRPIGTNIPLSQVIINKIREIQKRYQTSADDSQFFSRFIDMLEGNEEQDFFVFEQSDDEEL